LIEVSAPDMIEAAVVTFGDPPPMVHFRTL
jgi:hypothetical protein